MPEQPKKYIVLTTSQAAKAIKALTPMVQQRVSEAVKDLANWPNVSNIKKLKGQDAYRKRLGDYRIVFVVEANTVTITVVRIADRKDAYE